MNNAGNGSTTGSGVTPKSASPAQAPAPPRRLRPQKRPLRDVLLSALCGGVAGTAAKTAIAPLERVRIVCQVGESKGIVNTLRAMGKEEGYLSGFWRGNFTNCLRAAPHRAILFGSYDYYRDLITYVRQPPAMDNNNNVTTAGGSVLPAAGAPPVVQASTHFFAGALCGLTATMTTYPLDVARTRIVARIGEKGSRYHGLLRTLMLTVKEEGYGALYKGIGPSFFGCLAYEGLRFGAYGSYREYLKEFDPSRVGSKLHPIMAGALAGVTAGLLTYPNDTVRRRMQLQGVDNGPRKYRNAIDCYRTIARREGILALYRGCSVNLLRVAPSNAVQFGVFEMLKSLLMPPDEAQSF